MKIDNKWKLAAGLVAGLSANAVVAKIITNALGGKATITDVIGGGLISGLTGVAVSNEVIKLINVVNDKIEEYETEENTATEEPEPTEKVAEES